MSDEKYHLTAKDIAAMVGVSKTHFQNPNAQRINKSLGDATGLTGLGIHLIEVEPGFETTEFHVHYQEDEAVYILSGSGEAEIGETRIAINAGDFLGYRKGGLAHTIHNTGTETLRCLVIGQRLEVDIADYPRKAQRIYRAKGMPWDLVDHDQIDNPAADRKK